MKRRLVLVLLLLILSNQSLTGEEIQSKKGDVDDINAGVPLT